MDFRRSGNGAAAGEVAFQDKGAAVSVAIVEHGAIREDAAGLVADLDRAVAEDDAGVVDIERIGEQAGGAADLDAAAGFNDESGVSMVGLASSVMVPPKAM